MNIDFVENALWRIENAGVFQNKWDIIDSFMGSNSTVDEFEERLVELLKYADVSKRSEGELREAGLMMVPKDADGMFVHVGDEMCGYGYPDGGVYCQAIINNCMILVGTNSLSTKNWLLWSASDCRHHHKQTVEDLLREFGMKYFPHPEMQEKILAEYAAKLREVVNGD